MKKLEIGIENDFNKIAIFLNHRELINQVYNENKEQNKRYQLKAELFNFHPREIQPVENKLSEENNKRKRRRNATKTTEALSQELQELERWSNKCLEHLKLAGIFQAPTASIIPRFWEETGDFPQMRGANTINEYQSCCFGSQEYLIPPRCRFYNYDVALLAQLQTELSHFDLIVMDPPWRNKYIRRIKRTRQELGYKMLENEQLQKMPIGGLIHKETLVAIWCTNSPQHQQALLEQLMPAWQLRPLHALKWLKVNTAGAVVGPFYPEGSGHKQPFEMLYLACSQAADADFGKTLKSVEMLLSVPSIVHSHKPPLLLWLRELLPKEPKCLELFARYLQPNFTSVGLEVLKLMDKRLYKSAEAVKDGV